MVQVWVRSWSICLSLTTSLTAGVGGQELAEEVDGDLGGVLEVVLLDPGLDDLLELGVLLDERLVALARQPQQPAGRDRLDRGLAGLALEHAALAAELAAAEEGDIPAAGADADVHPAAAVLDDVHRAGGITLGEEHLALFHLDRLELAQERPERLGRELRKIGELTEEMLEMTVAGLQVEELADFRSAPEQGVEHRPIEAKHLHFPAGADGGGMHPAIDEAALPEGVAGPQGAERDLVAVVAPLDHAGTAGDEHVERIGGIALPHHDLAEAEGGGDETADHEVAHIGRQVRQDRDPLQDEIRRIGPAVAPRSPHASAPAC